MNNHKQYSKVEKVFLKKEYKERYYVIEEIMNEFDPVGLIGSGAPKDEYDCLTLKILPMLDNNKTHSDIRDFLLYELDHHFGYGINSVAEKYRKKYIERIDCFVSRVLEWHQSINRDNY